jgi:hypothetical protein
LLAEQRLAAGGRRLPRPGAHEADTARLGRRLPRPGADEEQNA